MGSPPNLYIYILYIYIYACDRAEERERARERERERREGGRDRYASCFPLMQSDEEEEMPPEARLKMRNIGK